MGENGSGKSSIIELLFRMVNNLAAVMLKDFERPAAEYSISPLQRKVLTH